MTIVEAMKCFGLMQSYNLDSLKKKYYQLAKAYHPDLQSNLTEEENKKKMQEVNLAYEILKENLDKLNVDDMLKNTEWKKTSSNNVYVDYNPFNYEYDFKKYDNNKTEKLNKISREISKEVTKVKTSACKCDDYIQDVVDKYIRELYILEAKLWNYDDLDSIDINLEFVKIRQDRIIIEYKTFQKEISTYYDKEYLLNFYEEEWLKNQDKILSAIDIVDKAAILLEIIESIKNKNRLNNNYIKIKKMV